MHIFSTHTFNYPYRHLKFPGQHSEEAILFITREGKTMLYIRWTIILLGTLILLLIRAASRPLIQSLASSIIPTYNIVTALLIAAYAFIALWWVYILWKKSVFIITTRRLTKFIHTTPWNRYQLSLGLDKIVDTGSYQKGLLQSLTRYGYFVARSSAGNIKNFKIINISYAEDLQNYVNKLLFTFNKQQEKLDTFRPFVPHLKGEARKTFVRSVTPEYYQDTPSRSS